MNMGYTATTSVHASGHVECAMLDPAALFWHLCSSCTGFSDFMEAEMNRTPCVQTRPWSIVLYGDEVSPGNQLKPDNRRASSSFIFDNYMFC